MKTYKTNRGPAASTTRKASSHLTISPREGYALVGSNLTVAPELENDCSLVVSLQVKKRESNRKKRHDCTIWIFDYRITEELKPNEY